MMTDQETIANHPGWVELAKKIWVWAVGDMAWYVNLNFVISVNDKEKLQLAQIYETFLYLEMDRDHFDVAGWYPKVDCIPIPRENQLMDMLEAKGFLKISIDKYITVKKDKEEEVLYACWVRGYFDELPTNFTVEAPTRLLALFAAVCKVYGLNGKAE